MNNYIQTVVLNSFDKSKEWNVYTGTINISTRKTDQMYFGNLQSKEICISIIG